MKVLGSHGNQYTGMSQGWISSLLRFLAVSKYFFEFSPQSLEFHDPIWRLSHILPMSWWKNHPTRDAPDSFEKDVSFQVYPLKFKE